MSPRAGLLLCASLLLLTSCGSTVRSVTDSPFSLRTPQLTNDTSSALVVYSDLEGGHLPPRAAGIKAGSHVVLSFVSCERHSEEYGTPSWSCHSDDSERTPEEKRVIERATACFDIERREASREMLAAMGADRRTVPASTTGTHLVFVKQTQINRNKENIALGCESAGGHPCDPVGSKSTGRTLEQVTRSHQVWVAGAGAPADPYLSAWPFPAWKADVSYAKIETPEVSFAPGESFTGGGAQEWLDRLSKVDEMTVPRAVRLALLWDRAILAFKVGDRARGEQALAAAEKELAVESAREPIDRLIAGQAPSLHALIDGTLTLADPCRRH